MPRTSSNFYGSYFLITSLIGLCLLAIMTFATSPSGGSSSWQRPLIGSVFVLICITGTMAGIVPSRCSSLIGSASKRKQKDNLKSLDGKIAKEYKGHHPDCGNFLTHTFQFRGKIYCAGCAGLIIGAGLSTFGTFAYFALRPQFEQVNVIIFWLGFLAVSIGLLQHNVFQSRKNYAHMLLNVVFVLGAFLLLVAIMEINDSLVLEAYFLILTLYWILARVLLSQEEHRRICNECHRTDCGFL